MKKLTGILKKKSEIYFVKTIFEGLKIIGRIKNLTGGEWKEE
jgi:hypothetical protein